MSVALFHRSACFSCVLCVVLGCTESEPGTEIDGTETTGGAVGVGGLSGDGGSDPSTGGSDPSTGGTEMGLGGNPLEQPQEPPPVTFERIQLRDDFVAEGATFGDFNGDGVSDVLAGCHWYEGPEFAVSHEFKEPAVFDPLGYSDNFFAFDHDFDSDGDLDALIVGFPGQSANWFENPNDVESHWARHEVLPVVDNEAPMFQDLTLDGNPELVCINSGNYGFATPGSTPSSPFEFQPISVGESWGNFTHGLGVGDVDGDGRLDVLHHAGIYFQPASPSEMPWPEEAHVLGGGGAQMFTYDVDGDGDLDVITTLNAHGYGVAWFEQEGESGQRRFIQHIISPLVELAKPGDLVLHEPHALTVIDVDGDGLLDIITGERFWGHVPEDQDFSKPAQLVWYRLQRGPQGARFVGYLVDDSSGVGTQVVARRLEGASAPSIVVANKKGVFVFRGTPRSSTP